MALHPHRPVLHPKDTTLPSNTLFCTRTARSAPARRTVDKQGASSTFTASTQDADAQHAVDNTPIGFILPDGRQFQIQFVVRRDGQPEYSFSGLNNLFSTTPTAFVDHISSDTAADPQHQHQHHTQAEDATEEDAAAAAATAGSAGDALPWSFSELPTAAHSFVTPTAAVHAASRTLAKGDPSAAAAAAAAGAKTAEDALAQQTAAGLQEKSTDQQLTASVIDVLQSPSLLVNDDHEVDDDDVGGVGGVGQEQQLDGRHLLQQQAAAAFSRSSELLRDMQQQRMQQQQQQISHLQETQGQQQQQVLLQQQQQQQQHFRCVDSSEAHLLAQISECREPWQLVTLLTRHMQRQVLTAAVAAAGLQQLDRLVNIHLVRQLRQGNSSSSAEKGKTKHQQMTAAAAAAAGGGGMVDGIVRQCTAGVSHQQEPTSSSSSSSSSSKRDGWAGPMFRSLQEEDSDSEADSTAAAAAAAGGTTATKQRRQQQEQQQRETGAAAPSRQFRLLMRVFLRLISVIEENIEHVPSPCLTSAAKLSAKLVGVECPVHDWWLRARGYVLLGEATARWQAGVLNIRSAVDVCYSYHHCGYKPSALLQPLLADVVKRPALLLEEGLNGTGLCHLTFCATSYMDTVKFSHDKLAAAVNTALHNPTMMHSLELAKPYNLVMLLRHLCQLSSNPPQGLVISDRVINPPTQEELLQPVPFSTTKQQQQQQHEEVVQQLGGPKQQQLLLAQQFLVKLQDKQQQQHQQQQQRQGEPGGGELLLAVIGRMPHMTMQELSTVLHVAVEWNLDCCQQLAAAAAMLVAAAARLPINQQQQQQQQWGCVPPLLLSACEQLQSELQSVVEQQEGLAAAAVAGLKQQQQQVTRYAAAWSSALSAAAAAVAGSSSSRHPRSHQGRNVKQQQQQQQRKRLSVQLPRTPADPVIFLHRLCQCGCSPPPQLTDWLLQQLGPNLHKISLLQANLLCRTLVYQWEDGQACWRLLAAGLGPWMTSTHTAASSSSSSSSSVAAAVVHPKVFQLPYWQLKALIVAAGRFGVLASDVAAAGSQHQQQQQQQHAQSSGRGIATAFLIGIIRHLFTNTTTSSSSSSSRQGLSTDISSWRADMVLALFWAAARLKVSPPPAVMSAGTAALTARMRRHIAVQELPHLVWAASELKVADKVFLDVLCAVVARNAHKLHSKSIAGAAWSLVQLRCPHTVVLEALSRALLRPDDISSSREILRGKIWHRQQQQQQQQQQQRRHQQSPSNADLHDWQSASRMTPAGHRAAAASSSTAGQSLNCPSFELLVRHPRVSLLGPEHVAKLAAACVMAGWAPPLLLLLLAVRAEVLMDQMPPALLAQLMWSYASANCPVSSLLHAAAARAAHLAAAAAFTTSKQPLALLGAFRALGLSSSEADEPLRKEVVRLKRIEAQATQQQQQQQQQREGRVPEGVRTAVAEASSVLQHGSTVLDQLKQVMQDADVAAAAAAVSGGDRWQQQQQQGQQQASSARR